MKAKLLVALWILGSGAALAQTPALDHTPLEARLANGDKVWLYPNGRWEYVDAQKAAEARKLAGQYPENQVRPAEAQGALLGVGRTLMPGDKDYNRGSLNPKLR